jgi:methanogenic corrinoid protein MtbC1
MIRWCSYCQRFLGEARPFDDPRFTHGICRTCEEKLVRPEELIEQTSAVRSLFGRMLGAARAGDEQACSSFLAEARALGMPAESILLGLLQPALYRAGSEWQEGRLSVAAEHRLTSWCDRVFSMLEPGPRPSAPLDLLLLQAPGNSHTLGPRIAARVLGARGVSPSVVVPDLPFHEVVGLAEELKPRFIGFSCALPSMVAPAVDLIEQLRERLEPGLRCRYVLGGFAFRQQDASPPLAVGPGIDVAADLDAFVSLLSNVPGR